MNKRWLAALLISALAQGGLRAAEDLLPASAFEFPSVQQGASARAIGMGSTYVGVAEGSAALLWNPAGLGGLQAPEIALHHTLGLLNATQDVAVFGAPLGSGNGLAVSLNYEDQGSFDGRDAAGNPTGNYAANAYGASLGWGLLGPAGFSIGLAAKANREHLAGTDIDAVAGDAGLLWSLDPALSVGVAYTNFGPDVQGRQLAQGLRVGIASYIGKCTNSQWLLALSGESLYHGEDSLHLGAEYTVSQVVALRAGYGFRVPTPDPEITGLQGWTFGGGVLLKQFSLDYAYVPLGDLGNMQRVSLTYSFGERCALPAVAVAPTPIPTQTPAPTAVPTAAASPVAASEAPVETQVYTVQPGDTLWDISGLQEVRNESAQWPLIYDANRGIISNPDKIYPGQELHFRRYYTENEIEEAENTANNTPPYEP